jgi:hypothetical protein
MISLPKWKGRNSKRKISWLKSRRKNWRLRRTRTTLIRIRRRNLRKKKIKRSLTKTTPNAISHFLTQILVSSKTGSNLMTAPSLQSSLGLFSLSLEGIITLEMLICLFTVSGNWILRTRDKQCLSYLDIWISWFRV